MNYKCKLQIYINYMKLYKKNNLKEEKFHKLVADLNFLCKPKLLWIQRFKTVALIET